MNKNILKNKLRLSTSTISICLLVIIILGLFSAVPGKYSDKNFENEYYVYAPKIPDNLSFAGEQVPLNSHEIRERLDRELLINMYWESQTFLFIKRINRYFPIIEPILKKNNIPEDFKYLALAESGLLNVTSPKKAVGFWQFLAGTAKDYKLEVNNEVDERYNIEKSTDAACRFLFDSYKLYNNWTLTAASYNAGRKGISTQLQNQKVTDYYDLLLNKETSRYMFRILAIKLILENPKEYGFRYKEEDLYKPLITKDLVVDSSISNLVDFAKYYSISYKTLKYYNPWLRKPYLTNLNSKSYIIKIPKE